MPQTVAAHAMCEAEAQRVGEYEWEISRKMKIGFVFIIHM